MNITFLIGNGFDINTGLKTRYCDFYKYYLSQGHNDILSHAISNDYENWADLECSLGSFLKNVDQSDIDDFLDSKARLENDLAVYLTSEAERLSVSKEKSSVLANHFFNSIVKFYSDFCVRDREDYLAWQRTVNAIIKYHFVTFNYTNSLEWIIENGRDKAFPGNHTYSSSKYQDELGEIIHIHGTLSGNLILGLNDVKQIDNPSLQGKIELTEYIVKPTLNNMLGTRLNEKAQKIISDSGYVCIYGMSLGDTDRLWWEFLLNWLKSQSTHRLVLFVHDDISSNISGQQRLRQINKWKKTFFNKANASEELIERIRNQIIVVVNSTIFDLDEIELSQSSLIEKQPV